LIERTLNLLAALKTDPVVVASGENPYAFLKYPVIHDVYPDKGPLGGVYTALCHAKTPLLILTCDMPFLTPKILNRLCDAFYESHPPVVIFERKGDFMQPFPGIYSDVLAVKMKQYIEEGNLSMQYLLGEVTDKRSLEITDEAKQFLNVNRADDLPDRSQ
jgi:molybdenum cofactor guanylyltransferase